MKFLKSKNTIRFIFIISIISNISYSQEHPLDKTFDELYKNSRENGSNSALSYELISEALIDEWDVELNRVYKELMKNLPENKKNQLKLSQRKWIEYRDLEFKLLYDIDKKAMYPQPKSREMKFIRHRVLELIDLNKRFSFQNNNLTIDNEENSPILFNKLVGFWYGRDNCSEGRNKNQWSNLYKIEFLQRNGKTYLKGLYFQPNDEIIIKTYDDEFIIEKQSLGKGNDFIIKGYGRLENGELIINYQVEVLVDLNTKEYITNYCLSKFQK